MGAKKKITVRRRGLVRRRRIRVRRWGKSPPVPVVTPDAVRLLG
jgi:hypothetical protein